MSDLVRKTSPTSSNFGPDQEGRKKQRGNDEDEGSPSPSPPSIPATSEFQWEEGRPHPLLIPHFLENVISYLYNDKANFEDFKTCRFVCKDWNQAANNIYKRSGKELVFGKGRKGKNGKITEQVESIRFEKFLVDTKQAFDSPFTKFRFGTAFFGSENYKGRNQLFKEFLFSHSVRIRSLKLKFNMFTEVILQQESYKDLKLEALEDLSFQCPPILKVKTGYDCLVWCKQKMELTYLFEALLDAATNLKKLDFSFEPPRQSLSPADRPYRRFADIIAQKCPKTVENLRLVMMFTEQQLRALMEKELSLKGFHYNMRSLDFDLKILEDFLNQQKDSLEELELTDSADSQPLELCFSKFPRLKWLKIRGGTEFSFPENFPALESLVITGSTGIEEILSRPSTTVRKLELCLKDGDQEIIGLIPASFPNLTGFHLLTGGRATTVPSVFQHLTELEHLVLTVPLPHNYIGERNLDHMLTGLSSQDVQNRTGVDLLSAINDPSLVRTPSISDIKKLRQLFIHGTGLRISDIAAVLGFMKIESLKVIGGSGIRSRSFSPDILNKLKERMQIVRKDKEFFGNNGIKQYQEDGESSSSESEEDDTTPTNCVSPSGSSSAITTQLRQMMRR